MTRRAGKWLAFVLISILAAGFLMWPMDRRTDIPDLSEDRLMGLDGFVPVASLLPGADHDFICLLGPYDETGLRSSGDAMPTGLRLDLLDPFLPTRDDEFLIVGLTASRADINRYDRRGLDILSGLADLDTTAQRVRDNRILCGRTTEVSFHLLPREHRRAMGIGLIGTQTFPLQLQSQSRGSSLPCRTESAAISDEQDKAFIG